MPSTTMRVFQIAKLLKVDSAEILDAVSDMGQAVSSDLAPVEEAVIEELRSLFKPKPKSAKVKPSDKAAKPKTVKKKAPAPADAPAAAVPGVAAAPAAGGHPPVVHPAAAHAPGHSPAHAPAAGHAPMAAHAPAPPSSMPSSIHA